MGRLLAVICSAIPLVGAVASVGCAQLVGIDKTNGSSRPADSLAVTRRSIGATLVDTPLDLTGLAATYFVARDGNATEFDSVSATPGPTGMWTTKLYDPAPVQFTLPDEPAPLTRLFAFPSPQLQVLFGVLEHPNRAQAPDGATFTVTAPLDAAITAADSFQTYVVGAWLQRAFAAAEAPVGVGTTTQIGPVTFSFTAANSVAGRPQLDQVTPQDAFLILRYAGGTLTGVAEPMVPVAQTEMATMVMTEKMVQVANDQMLDVKVNPSTFMPRYGAVRPAVGSLAMSWHLTAAPGYQTATDAGPMLRSGTLALTDLGVTGVMYGNPFAARGWNTMFVLTTSESRMYTAPGTTAAVSLFAGMNQFVDPSAVSELTLPAGLPIVVTLDGTPLSSDGQSITPPTEFVRVTFITDTPGGPTTSSADLYNLEVWDLAPNAMANALDRRLVFAAASNEPSFALPPEVFEMGHSYTLRAVATLGGFPTIGDGNFLMRQLPLAQSFLDSAVITVVP